MRSVPRFRDRRAPPADLPAVRVSLALAFAVLLLAYGFVGRIDLEVATLEAQEHPTPLAWKLEAHECR